MPGVNDALLSALPPAQLDEGSVAESKTQSVAAAAEAKQTAIGGAPRYAPGEAYRQAATTITGSGGATLPETTRLTQGLSPDQLAAQFGEDEGARLLQERVQGTQQFLRDSNVNRSGIDQVTDAGLSVGLGLGGSLGGIAALGLGAINTNAGTAASEFLRRATEGVQGYQSPELQAARRAGAVRNELDARDNTALFNQERANGASDLGASVRRIARDTYDSVGNAISDPVTLSDGIAQGVGSLLAAGPTTKAGSVLANAIGRVAPTTNALSRVGRAVLGEHAGTSLAIGAMEAGGAYTGTVGEALKVLEARTDLSDEQKRDIANRAGLTSAAITAPLSVAAGRLVAGFEANPLRGRSLQAIGRNVVNEALEEGLQGGTGQIAQNRALQNEADPTRTLSEGVGEQIGTGALYGLGTAGVLQAPGLSTTALRAGSSAAGNAVGSVLDKRVDRVQAAADASSPSSDSVVAQAANAVAESAPVVADTMAQTVQEATQTTPEAAPIYENLANKIQTVNSFDPAQYESSNLPDNTRAALSGATTRPEAVLQLAKLIENSPEDSADAIASVKQMSAMMHDYQSMLDAANQEEFDALPQDHAARKIVANFEDLYQKLETNPSVVRAMQKAAQVQNTMAEQLSNVDSSIFSGESILTQQNGETLIKGELGKIRDELLGEIATALRNGPVTVQLPNGSTTEITGRKNGEFVDTTGSVVSLNTILPGDVAVNQLRNVKIGQKLTPEQASDGVALAEMAPHKVPPAIANQITAMAERGELELTPAQMNALKAARDVGNAVKEAAEKAQAAGFAKPMTDVSRQVMSNEDGKTSKLSAMQHVKGIVDGLRAGNTREATDRLARLGNFVQHMKNKTEAMNAWFTNGGAVPSFQALDSSKNTWYDSKEVPRITPRSANSVELAQTVALEGERLANIYNSLVESFPELGGKVIAPTALVSQLTGNVQEVARSFADGTRTYPAKPTAAPKQEAPASASTRDAKEEDATVKVDPKKREEDTTVRVEPKVEAKPTDTIFKPTAEWQTVKDTDILPPGLDIRVNTTAGTKEARLPPKEESQAETLTTEPVSKGSEDKVKQEPKSVEEDTSLDEAPVETEALNQETFPKLLETPKTPNLFKRAFTKPKNATSRLTGLTSPFQAMRDALKSRDNFLAFVGQDTKRIPKEDTAKAYQDHLKLGDTIASKMNVALQDKFKTRFKSDVNNLDTNKHLHYGNLKVFNIADLDGKNVSYNPELLESAVLAGLQWILTAEQSGSGWLKNEDIAEMLEVSEADAAGFKHMVTTMNETVSQVEATRQLAQKIQEFWGLKASRSEPDGITKGIPEAVAKEMIRAMSEMNLVRFVNLQTSVRVNEDKSRNLVEVTKAILKDGKPLPGIEGVNGSPEQLRKSGANIQVREYPRIEFNDITRKAAKKADANVELSPLTKDLSLIERSVLTEPKDVNYFGDEVPKVTQTQMNNAAVENTKPQKQMIKNEQQTVHSPNLPMIDFYEALGPDLMLKAFGEGDLAGRKLNKNHAKTLEGKNTNVASAFKALQNVMSEARAYVDNDREKLGQLPIRYAYNVSKVGRLQMLGRFNPQANKIMREAILPTWSTLDLSGANPQHSRAFLLALGQHLDEKVHAMHDAQIEAKVAAKLAKLAPSIDLIETFFEEGKFNEGQLQTMKENFKAADVPFGPGSLHALMEHTRLQSSDKANFRTALYLEADGVTNGVVNAMSLISTGPYTPNELANMEKGGLFIRANGPQNMNEQRAGVDPTLDDGRSFEPDKRDLYQEATNHLANFQRDFWNLLSENSKSTDPRVRNNAVQVKGQLDHIMTLMEEFFPKGHIAYDSETGELSINRSVMKNPLTISLYGSGEAGIAGKLTSVIIDAVYERMSEVAQFRSEVPNGEFALAFMNKTSTDAAHARAKFEEFDTAWQALTNNVVMKSKDGLYVKTQKVKQEANDPEDYNINAQAIRNLEQNMLQLFVKPMTDAIKATVGQTLFDSARLIINATQAQSIFLEAAYKREIARMLAEKEKDPNWHEDDFLSQEEQAQALKAVMHLAPMIKTPNQTFFPAGRNSTDLTKAKFSQDLAGRQSTPAFTYSPGKAGVSAMPSLIIGFGDGMMIQHSSVDKGTTHSLRIFDGVNGRLDHVTEDGQAMNAAVWKSWQGNPLKALHSSFAPFMEQIANEPITEEMREALTQTFREPTDERGKLLSDAAIISRMKALEGRIETDAASRDARIAMLDKLNLSVDQMAAAKAPFVKTGEVINAADTNELAAELNKRLGSQTKAEPKVEQKTETKVETKPVEEVKPNVSAPKTNPPNYGRMSTHGVRLISAQSISRIGKDLGFTPAQQAVWDQLRRTKAFQGWTIAHGSPEQLKAWSDEKGFRYTDMSKGSRDNPMNLDVQGYADNDQQIIYLHKLNRELILHELIHAATFRKLDDYYDGDGVFNDEEVAAIKRLEALRDQFLDMPSDSPKMADVQNQVRFALTQNAKANALNEFMAWGLTNQKLNDKLSSTPALVQIAKDAFKAIKQFIFGRARVDQPGDDMLSNLMFNTSILIRAKPTLTTRMLNTISFMGTSYGNDQRLADIREGFVRKVVSYLNEHPKDRPYQESVVGLAITKAYQLGGQAIGVGFTNTLQEQQTFDSIVVALATNAQINPNAMQMAQKLYVHTIQNLDYRDLMKDPKSNDPNDEAQAQEKYRFLTGQFGLKQDVAGRSSLLPVFMALAMADSEFRAVLAKLPMPKTVLKGDKTLDGMLENAGNSLVDQLSKTAAGLNNSKNVQEALDTLAGKMQEINDGHQKVIDQFASKAGGFIDDVNMAVVEGMNYLGQAAVNKTEALNQKFNNKGTKFLADSAKLVHSIVDEGQADNVAMGIAGWTNSFDSFAPFRKLLVDLVGRTSSNAAIYDMIKTVKSMVQQDRQQFREHLPTVIAEKFKTKLSDEQWTHLFNGLGKTDIAALTSGMTRTQVLDLLKSDTKVKAEVARLEKELQAADPAAYAAVQKKALQLAHFMVTGATGTGLLRNAEAVSMLLHQANPRANPGSAYVQNVDHLVSLYALQNQKSQTRAALTELAKTETDGMDFVLAYLQGQRKDEVAKAVGRARFNHYKGYIPSAQQDGTSLIIASNSRHNELMEKSYKWVGSYVGSDAEGRKGLYSYYYAPVSARASFEQGILQNVHMTVGGVKSLTGYTDGMTAGRIDDPAMVADITKRIAQDAKAPTENLMPVFDESGVVTAYERSVNPDMLTRLKKSTHLAKMIGQWRGRQVEEIKSQQYNDALVDNLHKMWMNAKPSEKSQFVNVLDPASFNADAPTRDALNLMSKQVKDYATGVFGAPELWVRKDMLEDAFGYRSASLGDAWTGNTRWTPEVQKQVKRIAMGIIGPDAYAKVLNTELVWQNIIKDARMVIVVKSVVVPVANVVSNIYQLISRGVPMMNIAKSMPKKLAEVNQYSKDRIREIELEAELRAAENDPMKSRPLKVELRSIQDGYKRMSIWPLIEAGEFSAISDVGISRDEILLSEGRWHQYIERLTDKLPNTLKTAGRYALVTKDTALFQGMQKAVEFGDFLAKSIIYDDLTVRQKKSKEYALGRVTEEFVNYDRLPGRFRGALEANGLLWFYHFKIRAAKIGLSMIRNNPVHALLAGVIPEPISGIGTPITDNIFSKAAHFSLGNSIGPGMAFQAMHLNPWINLLR
jgi:hypothetical protein